MKRVFSITIIAFALLGCEKAEQPASSTPTETTEKRVEKAPKTETDRVKIDLEKPVHNWSLKIDGYDVPESAGRVVIPVVKDNVTSFAFAGTRAQFRIDINDLKDGKHTYTPAVVTAIYPSKKVRCGFKGFKPDQTNAFEVTIEKEGENLAADFKGDLNCGPVDGGETTKVSASGMFQK